MDNIRRKFKVTEKGMKEFATEVKNRLNLKEGDEIEMIQNFKLLTLVKSGNFCVLCGSDDALCTLGNGKNVCKKCFGIMCREIM